MKVSGKYHRMVILITILAFKSQLQLVTPLSF